MELYSVSIAFWTLYLIVKSAIDPSFGDESYSEENTLVLLHVIFRHGNRTANGPEELYPKDPYVHETYFPFGLGQLTNAGKVREFSIGQALRARYNDFLGDLYYPGILEARSTDYNRTKASLQLVLAGLFPPKGNQIWNKNLLWQPIPYNYEPSSKDRVLIGVNCPNFMRLQESYIQSAQHRSELSSYNHIFRFLSNNTGLNITTFLDVYNLYFGLVTEDEWGYELPQWTKSVWPETIIELAIKHYFVETGTTELSRMSCGYFLKKMLSDTNVKINGTKKDRKMHLYSAHENNIADLLIVLGVFDPPHIPTYGSYITFEIHKINNTHGVKIYYENYNIQTPELLKLPACETFCEMDKFISLIEEYIPDDYLCGID